MAEENNQNENSQNNEEEVIVIEDEKESEGNSQKELNKNKKDKKLYFILIALLVVLIILFLILLFILVKEKENNVSKKNMQEAQIKKITQKLKKKHFPKQEIQLLIKKANILYMRGKKIEALKLLNKLSIYSEALSNYNLGVIKIKEKEYKEAIRYFNKAISNKDNRALSAINAAYCSLKLNDKKKFKYYTELAELYLPEESKSKSYPFYYALINYYLGREFNSLVALNVSKTYPEKTKQLKTSIYNLYDDVYNVLNYTKDPFILGISYARIGEYKLAKQELQKVVNGYPLKAGVALGLVELKLHEYKNAAEAFNIAKNKGVIVYPINVIVKPDLFNIKAAQKSFKDKLLTKENIYKLLFYYAPYKVFNINQTMNYLQKGSYASGLNIEQATSYLNKSYTISKLNIKMSEGIKYAIGHHILKANKILSELARKYPYHSILHYDLGLTYINLKNYKKAYYHFLRAYHLDSTNYLAGIFAIIIGNKFKFKSVNMIKRNLNNDIDFNNPKNKIFTTLLSFINNNYPDIYSFIESDYKKTKFNVMLALGISNILDKKEEFLKQSMILKSIDNKDIVSNLLYFYATHKSENMNKFALNFQHFFVNGLKKWDLNIFYFGSLTAFDIFSDFAKISGELPKLKLILQNKLLDKLDIEDSIPVLQKLAFVDLYTKHFEESYTIFNDLIDNKGVDDYKTLFYGAVASILADHHANAIALLALSKRKNKNAFEARYGLGLLYHEAKNLRGATIQYLKIPNGFISKFFDFELKP